MLKVSMPTSEGGKMHVVEFPSPHGTEMREACDPTVL